MPSPAVLLPILLAPVAALLFLDLLRSRRLRYPHELLEPADRRGRASLLFKSFRGRYDVLLDAAAAIVLAFAIPASAPIPAGEAGRRAAVVVDCSRSMLSGERGSRPLDLALRRLAEDPALAGAEAFALAFDPGAMRTRLFPISRIASEAARARRSAARAAGIGGGASAGPAAKAEALADALSSTLRFFAVDYSALGELRGRGYGRVTLLTDEAGGAIEGVELLESGFPSAPAAYPTAVRFDQASGSWIAALAESGPRGALALYAWDPATGKLAEVPRTRYVIEESASGRLLRFAEGGLYLASIRDPGGGQGIELAFRLDPRDLPSAASGPFSERMAGVFPFLARSAKPEVALRDSGSPAPPGSPLTLATALLAADGGLILDPALAGGKPVAAGLAAGADFALGPSSIANEDLPLAYDAAIRALARPPFAVSPPADATALAPFGGCFIAKTPRGPMPLVPPAREFFEPRGEPTLRIAPPSRPRWPWGLALAAIAGAKLAAWRLLSRRRPRPAGA